MTAGLNDPSFRFNFSWIEDKVIAGSSKPFFQKQFELFKKVGIRVLINLTEETYQNINDLDKFTIYHIPIPDFNVPSIEQINEFWQICKKHEEKKEPILVHCIAGCGRTGIMLGIWLLLKGIVKSGKEAIEQIRLLRPCSIETLEQEDMIKNINVSEII